MSYTVDIWTRAFPADDALAWSMRNELLADEDERFDPDQPFETPSPEMVELHRRLTSRFPCICDDESGPWSDGPLINNFGQGTATLGISFSRVQEVLPFLVASATSMGFHVFDGQEEMIHRPLGFTRAPERQPSPRRRSWWKFWS